MTTGLLDGSVYRRCGCRDRVGGRQLAGKCPRLMDPVHGRWYFAVQISTLTGRRVRVRRGGYATLAQAERARQSLLALPDAAAAGRTWTMQRWPEQWLTAMRDQVRPSTMRCYRDHVRNYLIPLLGRIRLASLRPVQVQARVPRLHVRAVGGSSRDNPGSGPAPSPALARRIGGGGPGVR